MNVCRCAVNIFPLVGLERNVSDRGPMQPWPHHPAQSTTNSPSQMGLGTGTSSHSRAEQNLAVGSGVGYKLLGRQMLVLEKKMKKKTDSVEKTEDRDS